MMYSPDGIGLGHVRRNASIASRFVREVPGASVLMLVGCPAGVFFELPSGVDYLKLPSVLKVATNTWESRSLPIIAEKAKELRSLLIQRTAELFAPHLFLVDHNPAGVWGELLPTLRMFRSMANPPKVVLGLRDILDAPEVVRATWERDGVYDTIGAYYDRVFIYGSRDIYDAAFHYGLNRFVSEKVDYCGYLRSEDPSRSRDEMRRLLEVENDRLVIVTAGGGYDAYPMMAACVKALRLLGSERPVKAIVITGPLMSRRESRDLQRQAMGLPVRILNCVPDGQNYVNAADLVITMGGYNSLMESIGLRKRTLVIPRKGPSAEQKTRAAIFSGLGLVQWIDPEGATPWRLAQAIRDNLHSDSTPSMLPDIDGLQMVVNHLKRLLELHDTPASKLTSRRTGAL